MTALTVRKAEVAAPRFSPDDIALIKSNICKGATDEELKLFLYHCNKTGLDPLARQIYSLERNSKQWVNGKETWVKSRSIQVSIDGFRLIAERSGHYAGQVGPYWCGDDGEWVDVWVKQAPPVASKVGVLRDDFKEPCWGVARFDSYAQKTRDGGLTKMWATMGDLMIAKCAEALALRKAFPQELSGLYTSDEMEQAGEEVRRPNPHVTRPADVVDAEVQYDDQGQPIDNIPLGDARIEPLPKAKARNDFAVAQFELRQIKTEKDLTAWGNANANRIASYPVDWQEILRGIYAEHMAELRAFREAE
jgi:phage recombination protein Bet